MSVSTKVEAEKAARAMVPAPDVHEVVVSDAAPRGTSPNEARRFNVRVLLRDESERCFEYTCAADGTGGAIVPIDCGTGAPLPEFEDPPYRG